MPGDIEFYQHQVDEAEHHVLSLSYGKDSMACLAAIEQLGWPLDRIVHAEVWATDTIHADLPPMVEFKEKADEIIKRRWGIEVEHVCAMKDGEKLTYEKMFYHVPKRKDKNIIFGGGGTRIPFNTLQLVYKQAQNERSITDSQCRETVGANVSNQAAAILGFPIIKGNWCTSELKRKALPKNSGGGTIQYLGIAADEPERIARHEKKENVMLPLVAAGWDEAYCRHWCENNGLLSPIYTTATRGGCWFCHNQGVEQLRLLRHNYPKLWSMMLKWDNDSPVTFHPDGHTVHDFDKRFTLEDLGLIRPEYHFNWTMIKACQLNMLDADTFKV